MLPPSDVANRLSQQTLEQTEQAAKPKAPVSSEVAQFQQHLNGETGTQVVQSAEDGQQAVGTANWGPAGRVQTGTDVRTAGTATTDAPTASQQVEASDQPVDGAQSAQEAVLNPGDEATQSPGEKVLAAMNNLSENIERGFTEAAKAMQDPSTSTDLGKMIQVQVTWGTASVDTSLLGKSASELEKTLKQLQSNN